MFKVLLGRGHSLQSPCRGNSNEYHQYMLELQNKKNYPQIMFFTYCLSTAQTIIKKLGSFYVNVSTSLNSMT